MTAELYAAAFLAAAALALWLPSRIEWDCEPVLAGESA